MGYVEDNEIWKELIMAVLERALADYVGKYPCNGRHISEELNKERIKSDAQRFLNGEICELYCECVGIDVKIIRVNMNRKYEDIAKKKHAISKNQKNQK